MTEEIINRLQLAIQQELYKPTVNPRGLPKKFNHYPSDDEEKQEKWYLNGDKLKEVYISFMNNELPEDKFFSVYKIRPIQFYGNTKETIYFCDTDDEEEEEELQDDENSYDETPPDNWLDFDVMDAENKVYSFRMKYNQGDADANTGCWGYVSSINNPTDSLIEIVDSGGDSQSIITLTSRYLLANFAQPKLIPDRTDEFEDMLGEDSYLDNEYLNNHYLEKIVGVAMNLPLRKDHPVYYNSVPFSLRVELAVIRLEKIVTVLPKDVLSIIACYVPAEFKIPVELDEEYKSDKKHNYYFSGVFTKKRWTTRKKKNQQQ
jgi:hypothetical protein